MEAHGHRGLRRRAIALTGCALVALVGLPSAALGAGSPSSVTYHYFDCVGPAGTPETFEAVKPVHSSWSFQVVGTNEVWFLRHVESVATGDVIVDVALPNGIEPLDTITCLIMSPIAHELRRATGYFAPIDLSAGR